MNQQGIVSIISVSIVAILVLVITVASSSLMIGEFGQSIDNENSVKAYYGAYSGLEETYAMVSAANAASTPLTQLQQDCNAPTASIQPSFLPDVSNARGGIGHTCRVIQAVTIAPQGTIDVDKVAQYNLTFGPSPLVATKNIGGIELKWDGQGGAPPQPVIFTIVSYPKNKGAAPPDIRSLILSPGAGATPVDFNSRTSSANTIVTGVSCPGPIGARCIIRINNLLPAPQANYDTILRLRPYFGGITYSMTVYDEGGAQLKVGLPNINADMTSRSGDAFLRLSNTIPVQSKPLSILDNVIFGNNSICKDFEILTDNAGYQKVQAAPTVTGCQLDNTSQQ